MLTLINIEFYKIFSKWRTYIGFMAVAGATFLIQLLYYLQGSQIGSRVYDRLADNFFISGDLLNGFLIGYFVLNALSVHIPFLITLVGGDILAGEATSGTFRMLITRPVSRTKIIFSKFIAGFLYVELLLLTLAILSIGLSVLLFGSGDLLIFGRPILILPQDEILWRFLASYSFASISMMLVFSLSFLFSALVENAVGPIMATMSVIIVMFVISALDIEILENIRPYLFTTYMSDWKEFFKDTVDYKTIANSIAVLLGHISLFFVITLYIFKKKDILS